MLKKFVRASGRVFIGENDSIQSLNACPKFRDLQKIVIFHENRFDHVMFFVIFIVIKRYNVEYRHRLAENFIISSCSQRGVTIREDLEEHFSVKVGHMMSKS